MKKYLLWILPLILIYSCSKDQKCEVVNVTAPANEVAKLKAYLDSNNITATADPRGFFYIINNAGGAEKPNACSSVTADYVGKLTNGTTFDSNQNIAFSLEQVILGWQEGVPLVGSGGNITLFLPPSLGYGQNAVPKIPANSDLIFQITVRSFR